MEEYINTLLEQIRCQKVHTPIARELRAHLEDQAADNERLGMKPEEAMHAAIRDMGDPVETGISLDHIHRPQIAWNVILLMAVISLCNILLHVTIGLQNETIDGYTSYAYISRSILHVVLGFAAMLLFYRLDYSFLGKYARPLAILFYGYLFWEVFFNGLEVHGRTAFTSTGPIRLSVIYLTFLSVPLYAALLYRYHGTGYRGIAKAFLWMLVPFIICWRIPCLSQALLLFFMMSLLLSLAVFRGWFQVAAKRFLLLYWSGLILFPILLTACGIFLNWFAVYQVERIKAFFSVQANDFNYMGRLLHSYLTDARLFGKSSTDILIGLPNYNQDYILTFVSSYYGIAAAVFIGSLVLLVGYKAVHLSLKQKNQLGLMIGCACGIVFLTTTLVNILENLNFLPLTETFLPFFSYGGTGQIVSYILVGIFLSVYRYQNIHIDLHTPETA